MPLPDASNRLAVTHAVPLAARGARRRGHDRRTRFAEFLGSLSGALQPERDARELKLRFEDGLRRLVPFRKVALRVGPLDPQGLPGAAETITLDVPTGPLGSATIEAAIDPAAGLDEWDLQLLRSLRHIAALVVEIDRCYRALPVRRGRPPESMPLIGSSEAIAVLRERIARVAATDFTVLIEGGIDPEPHPAQG